MNALHWLKKYNILYRDDASLIIDECNLSWMEDKNESEMEDIIEIILIFFALFSIMILFCIPIFSRIKLILRAKMSKNNVRILK